ncbi:MAG: acyltransferase, partial [Pirellula sp.]
VEGSIGKFFDKAIQLGVAGVDLFFVLSGFLITSVLLEAKGSRNYFREFYWRRSLRIFPLYFAALALFVWVIPWLCNRPNLFQAGRENQVYLWTYITNLKMSWDGEWCFGDLDHFWSLAIEEQFYLVWPLVVLVVARNQLARVCFVLAMGTFVARTVFVLSTENRVAADLFTLFRCDGLLLGAVIAAIWQKTSDWSSQRGKLLLGAFGSLGLLAIVGNRWYESQNTVVVIGWAFFLAWVLASNRQTTAVRMLESSPLTTLGKYSYGMYVFQSPLIPIMEPFLTPSKMSSICQSDFWGGVCYVGLMSCLNFVVAMLSWHCFESWFLRLRDRPKTIQSTTMSEYSTALSSPPENSPTQLHSNASPPQAHDCS